MNDSILQNLLKHRLLHIIAGILLFSMLSFEQGMAQSNPPKKISQDYNVPKGKWNLILLDNLFYHHWTYVPVHEQWDHSSVAILGIGAGIEYAYIRNRTVSLIVETGRTGMVSMEPSEGANRHVGYYNVNLLHTWCRKRLAVSIGPTLGWKDWSYYCGEEWYYPIDETDGDFYLFAKFGRENFEFTRFSAGADIQVFYYLDPEFGFGVEYAPRYLWDTGAQGKIEQQWALKVQMRIGLNKNKKRVKIKVY